MNELAPLALTLPRFTLVVGKGGVGKTTCAVAIAAQLADQGHRTLLLSTDPADTLAEALGHELDADPRAIPEHPALDARQLSAHVLRERFLQRWRETIVQIMDRGTYLDLDDISGLVDTALPGADEVFAVLELAELERGSHYDHIVVDTAPIGHTLRLLALPATFEALIALLDAMQEKHRFMVQALTHRYRADAADAFLAEMRDTVESFSAALRDSTRISAVLITRAEPVVVAESERFAHALAESGIEIAAVVANAVPAGGEDAAIALLAEVAPGIARVTVPAWLISSAPAPAPAASVLRRPAVSVFDSQLLVVAGKGGVGKTTASCAVAIAAADRGSRVLLVSTDPAPSVADALGIPVGDEEVSVPAVDGLTARQIDAAAAFARLRDEYQSRVDALFDALVARGVDVAHDRAILRDLLSLAPPGIDELYALAFLGEVLAGDRFDRVVVDPAPTGHLLRLLEMPALALEWSHHLLRLMLKYREIAGPGEAAQELLEFARRTRALQSLLRDHQRASALVVMLDEPLVRGETSRLLSALRSLDVYTSAILWNRSTEVPAPLPTDADVAQLVARPVAPPPVGVEALRTWFANWTELTASHG